MVTMPDFKKDSDGEAERKRALARLPENMKEEARADTRTAIEKAQKRGAPPKIIEPRCKVCTHPNRQWIEKMIVLGETPTAISRAFEHTDEPVPRRSVSNHQKEGHLDLRDAALRAVIESEAELEGRNHEEGVRDILTKRGVFEVMFRKGYEDVVNGNITVEPRDMIQMARVMAEWESQAALAAVDEARLQVQIFTQAIRNTWTPEMQAALVAEIKRLKKTHGLEQAEQLLESESSDTIVDAEVLPA